MRRVSLIILVIGGYTMVSEAVNEYTTLLGWYHGFRELDPLASQLLTISPVLQATVVFAIPTGLLFLAFLASKDLNLTVPKSAFVFLLTLTMLLAISTTYSAITDYNTLHAYHLLSEIRE
jgi:hypothetical protein